MFNLIFSTLFMNSLTPKFYVALTGTSSLVSGLILIFEWWYYKKYGISFLEQLSITHLTPWFGGSGAANGTDSERSSSSGESSPEQEVQVSENPYKLFRGPEYSRYLKLRGKEPLTFYDMNLSAQEHQNLFPLEIYSKKEDFDTMQRAWRERDPLLRVSIAEELLQKNPDCVPALVLLGEEGSSMIIETESRFRDALRVMENSLARRRSGLVAYDEDSHAREMEISFYVRRRLAMCFRKLRKFKEAVKIMKDLLKEFPMIMDIQENLIECLLEMKAYADVQAVMAKYDDVNIPKSATIVYTAALLKCRCVGERFSPDVVSKRGISAVELSAIEAIHRAVEFNPHVPKYLLEEKSLILPPEHIVRRGDSEALAYSFFNLDHWKEIDGALKILHMTWEGTFRSLPYPLEKGHYFHPYSAGMESAERELLPAFHEVSVYPQKEVPFFITFTAALCCVMAMLAVLTHAYPEFMTQLARTFIVYVSLPVTFLVEKLEAVVPPTLMQNLARI
ncbi:Protein ST7-like protein [Hypsibius exemplaris]|uniref:Protein ST7 homolog n=1 Tax=Hypsibius exemplaris TaxID=2072580 RepID=A0A1W0XAF3_HYPEX|nr:Protein ST7-like protein [Hypsibius exemplaris]